MKFHIANTASLLLGRLRPQHQSPKMLSYTTPFWTRLFLILSLLLPTLTLAVPVEHATIEPRANVRDIPGVAELKGQIQSWGVATRLPSVFYTNWPTGLNDAQTWGRDMFDEDIGATKATWKFAIWGRLVSGEWLTSVTSELQDQMEAAKYPASRIKSYQDVLSKNLCQALGETVKGDVYLIVGDDVVPDNNWDVNTAWGGKWHAPARLYQST